MLVAVPSVHHTLPCFRWARVWLLLELRYSQQGWDSPWVNRHNDLVFRMLEVSNGSGLASECSRSQPSALPPIHPSGNVHVYDIPSDCASARDRVRRGPVFDQSGEAPTDSHI